MTDPYFGVDGALDAPAVTGGPQYPNLLFGYPIRPPWMVAGVDYAVGPPSYWSAEFADPRVAVPRGCVVGPDGASLIVQDDGVVLQGLDFSVDGGVTLSCPFFGNLTIVDCRFGGGARYRALATGPIDFRGRGLTIQRCSIDGGFTPATVGAATYPQGLVYLTGDGGGVTMRYCYLTGAALRVVSMGSASSLNFQFNLIDEVYPGLGALTAHLAWVPGTREVTNVVWNFNTSVQKLLNVRAGDGPQFFAQGGLAEVHDASCQFNTALAPAGAVGAAGTFLFRSGIPGRTRGNLRVGNNYVDASGTFGAYSPGWLAAGFVETGPTYDMITGAVVPLPR